MVKVCFPIPRIGGTFVDLAHGESTKSGSSNDMVTRQATVTREAQTTTVFTEACVREKQGSADQTTPPNADFTQSPTRPRPQPLIHQKSNANDLNSTTMGCEWTHGMNYWVSWSCPGFLSHTHQRTIHRNDILDLETSPCANRSHRAGKPTAISPIHTTLLFLVQKSYISREISKLQPQSDHFL